MQAPTDHAAVAAWRELRPAQPAPQAIVQIKRKAKGAVYRLEGVGERGADVIAKRCERRKGEVEALVYREVYPRLPLPTLHFYGLVEESGGAFCWLFLEDVGQVPYRAEVDAHRSLAGRWFGALHDRARTLELRERLPARDAAHYRGYLLGILECLPGIPERHGLGSAGCELLEEIVSSCRALEQRWDSLEAFCGRQPRTLVHGDCLWKNVHVCASAGGDRLVPFDWGGAGWGLVGTDLGLLGLPYEGAPAASPDLEAYRREIESPWPDLDLPTLEQLVQLGQLFWALKVIQREIPAFDYEWARVEDTLGNFRIYARALTDALDRSTCF